MFALLVVATALPFAISAAGLAGGVSPATLPNDDPNVLFGLAKIKSSMNLGATDSVNWSLTSATQQVVAGMLYELTYKVTTGSTDQTCVVKVWSRPWLSGDDAMMVSDGPTCTNNLLMSKRQFLAGGVSSADINAPEIKAALNFAAATYNSQVNYMFSRKPVLDAQASVSKQVVAGMKYVFSNIDMADTACQNNGAALDSCAVTAGGNVVTCSFTVIDQAWMTPRYTLSNFSCQ